MELATLSFTQPYGWRPLAMPNFSKVVEPARIRKRPSLPPATQRLPPSSKATSKTSCGAPWSGPKKSQLGLFGNGYVLRVPVVPPSCPPVPPSAPPPVPPSVGPPPLPPTGSTSPWPQAPTTARNATTTAAPTRRPNERMRPPPPWRAGGVPVNQEKNFPNIRGH